MGVCGCPHASTCAPVCQESVSSHIQIPTHLRAICGLMGTQPHVWLCLCPGSLGLQCDLVWDVDLIIVYPKVLVDSVGLCVDLYDYLSAWLCVSAPRVCVYGVFLCLQAVCMCIVYMCLCACVYMNVVCMYTCICVWHIHYVCGEVCVLGHWFGLRVISICLMFSVALV